MQNKVTAAESTPAAAVIQLDPARGRFRVARSAYVNPALHAEEMNAIFSRCWLFVGHDSEIAQPNDFVARTVAGRPVVLLRDRDGEVRCFLNVCPHRGAQLVRQRRGSMRAFTCIYHGWGFENTGRNVHIAERDTYAPGFDQPGCNDLAAVPRLEQYRGLWFLNFDRGAPALEAYLGRAREYIDLVLDPAEQGMRVVGEPQEYSARANWKLLAENSTDILHVTTLHPTYLDLVRTNSAGTMERKAKQVGASVDLGNGHTVVEREASYGRPIARWIPIWGEQARVEIEGIRARLDAKYGKERAHRMANCARNLLIFPNLVINDIMSVTLRTFQPTAVDYMEISVWAIAPAEEQGKPAMARRLTNFLEFLGPAGFATPDDIEAFESCQRAYGGWREAPWNDFSKGLGAAPDVTDELPQRVFWLEWRRRLLEAAR